MKPGAQIALAACLVAISAPGHAQSPWSYKQSYDLQANRPISLLSLDGKAVHSKILLPAWSITPSLFCASYTGSKGLGLGGSLQLSTTWRGVSLFAGLGQGYFNTSKGLHPVAFVGLTVRPK